MASRFWISGTGNWDTSTTTQWSTTDGGTGGASVPTASDDVFFTASSGGGTVTVTATANCLSFTSGAFTGAFTFNAGVIVVNNISLPTTAITIGGSFGFTVNGTSSMTFNGCTISGGLAVTSASSNVTFADTARIAGTLTHSAGTLNTNSKAATIGAYSNSASSSSRTLTLGSSAISMSGSWTNNTAAGITITANTATLTLTGANSAGMGGGSVNYNGLSVVFTGGGSMGWNCGGTVSALTFTGTAVKTGSVNFTTGVTITNAFTVTGNSAINRVLLFSNITGTARTISAGSVSLSNVDFQDITNSGTTWTGTSLGDALGNSGITFDVAATQFWVSGTGSWSDSTKWMTTSGGAVAGRVPLPQDTARFDVNSFTAGSQTITLDMPRLGKDLNYTGVTNTPNWSQSLSAGATLYGSFTGATMARTSSGSNNLIFAARSSVTLTSGGLALPTTAILAFGGTVTLQDAYTNGGNSISVTMGTFDANGQTVSTGGLFSTGTNTRAVVMGSGAWSLTANGALLWSTVATGLTLTVTGNTTSFTGTSGSNTIATGGLTMPNVTFNGVGGSWQLTDDFTTAGIITLTAGTLDTNGKTIIASKLSSNNSNTRTLTLGLSNITLSLIGNAWDMNTTTNMTFSGASSTITLSGASSSFAHAGTAGSVGAFGSVLLTGAGSPSIQVNTGSIVNFTRTGTAVKTDGLTVTGNPTITGSITLTGNSVTNRLLVGSGNPGTARFLKVSNTVTQSITNVDFMDGGSNGTGTLAGTSIGDCGGNTGITADAPATQTHTTSAGGNWSDNTKWTSRVPLPQDNVIVDANTSGTLTADMPRMGANIDFTGFAGTASLSSTSNTMFGNLTFATGMTVANGQNFTFAGRGNQTVTSAGKSFSTSPATVLFAAPGGTYTLQDAFTQGANSTFQVSDGTFTTNDNAITSGIFSAASGHSITLNLGASVITSTITSVNNFWNTGSSNTTVNAGTSQIVLSVASANARTFIGGGKTFGTLTYTVAGSTGTLIVTGSNTFNTINFSDVTNARTMQLTSTTTTTVTRFNVNGTSGKLMTLNAVTGGSAATITTQGTTVTNIDYINIQDSTATGGSGWFAGPNSTNVSGNTGWTFNAAGTYESDNITFSETVIILIQANLIINVIQNLTFSESTSLAIIPWYTKPQSSWETNNHSNWQAPKNTSWEYPD